MPACPFLVRHTLLYTAIQQDYFRLVCLFAAQRVCFVRVLNLSAVTFLQIVWYSCTRRCLI